MREEKVFYDLGKVFLPSDAISKQGKRDCWRAVPYRLATVPFIKTGTLKRSYFI